MPIEVTPFWGNGTNDENGQDFLRAYNRAMAKETEEHKLAQFQNYLHSQSIADDWYTSLNANIKTSWDTLQAAFNNRWPNTAIVRKTKAEYELEIVGKKLMVEVLGKTKLVGGREVYTHTAWADEMARLVLEADVTGTTYITQVRKGLPTIIRDKLEEEYESWTAFLTAVKGISATYIKEKKEDEEERRKEIMQLIESPRTELSRVLGNTTLGPSPPSAPVTNPPLRTGVGLGFGPRPPQQPRAYPAQGQRVYSPQEREAFRARMNTLPHHPNTEAGRAAHQAQQKAWRDQYGLTATVTEMTPYPLRPGTSRLASGECFKCGMGGRDQPGQGHFSNNCPTAPEQHLHANEQRWRAICAFMMRTPREAATAVRLVVVDDYGTVEEIGGDGNGEQGKD